MYCPDCMQFIEDALTCSCGAELCSDCYDLHTCEGAQPPLWPHQERCLEEFWRAVDYEEAMRLLITAPCGMGKSRLQAEITKKARMRGWRIALYTHRKLLTEQTHKVLDSHEIDHGIMAADWQPALLRAVQLCSIWTVHKRAVQQERWEIPQADLVLVDEAHLLKSTTSLGILKRHTDQGAVIAGFTATPVGLAHIYNRLIIAGSYSEGRRCGALVPCQTFGPSEPDFAEMSSTKMVYSRQEQVGLMYHAPLFGLVYDSWKRLNPHGKPTLLFAPGVAESRWFVEEFKRKGIRAAHIDGQTPMDEREEILGASRDGKLEILCNRFVLREAVDLPHIACGILACVIGKPSTYIQVTGRILRASPGLDVVTLLDHGGHWWRPGCGSPNQDRHWKLEDTDQKVAQIERRARKDGTTKEPIRCPVCSKIMPVGPTSAKTCPFCGKVFYDSVRRVVQQDGTLVEMKGPAIRELKYKTDAEKEWNGAFWASIALQKKCGRRATMRGIRGWYRRNCSEPPPNHLWNCPSPDSLDWERSIEELHPSLVRGD